MAALLRIQERDGGDSGGGGGAGGKAAAEEEESALEEVIRRRNQLSFGVVGSLKAMCEGTRRARGVPHELKSARSSGSKLPSLCSRTRRTLWTRRRVATRGWLRACERWRSNWRR